MFDGRCLLARIAKADLDLDIKGQALSPVPTL